MRVNNKRLREIIVNDFVENGMDFLKKEAGHRIPTMVDAVRKGRSDKKLEPYWSRHLQFEVYVHLLKKGFKAESNSHSSRSHSYRRLTKDGTVLVKLFSFGKKNTWILIPTEIAEKILVFGLVPDLS